MTWPTKIRLKAPHFIKPDGTYPATTSRVVFELTHQLTSTVTGDTVLMAPIVAHLDSTGRMLDPNDGLEGVLLDATNDPETAEQGVTYAVHELIEGQEPRAVPLYYVPLAYDSPGGIAYLGLIPHGATVTVINYGLSAVTVPAPLTTTLTAGVAHITWDGTGAVGDVLTKTGTGPAVYGFAAPTGGGGGGGGGVTLDDTNGLILTGVNYIYLPNMTLYDEGGGAADIGPLFPFTNIGDPLPDVAGGAVGSGNVDIPRTDHQHPLSSAYKAATTGDADLVAWTAGESYQLTSITYDSTYPAVLSTATVLWPDGSAGTFTTDTINTTHSAIDAYHVSHTTIGKTVTQALVTRNGAGLVITKPALTVA